MKFSKVLASVAAATVAVSTLAVSAFAGSVTMSDSSWWTEKEVALEDLLDGVAAEDVVSFTFSSDTSFTVGYNNVEGGWSQVDVTDPSVTLDDILVVPMEVTNDKGETETKEYYLKICISKGDGVDYTINWTANTAANPGETTDPVEPGETEDPTKPGETEDPTEPGTSDDVNPGTCSGEPVSPDTGVAVAVIPAAIAAAAVATTGIVLKKRSK